MHAANEFSAKVGPYLGRPTDADVRSVRDVILCVSDHSVDTSQYLDDPPIASPILRRRVGEQPPVDLGRGVMIDRLPKDEAELVMTACSPRGHYFAPIRQFGQRYAFVR